MSHASRQRTLFSRPLVWSLVAMGLASSSCSYDWSVHHRDAGLSDDADVTADDGDVTELDAASSNAVDDDAGITDVPDGQRQCDEGDCGPNATCDQQTQLCVCATDYVESGSGCVPDPCRDSSVCASPLVCVARAGAAHCECPADTMMCGDSCLNVSADAYNCGACGLTCATGLSCDKSVCGPRVHALQLTVGESCVLFEASDGNYPVRCWGTNKDQLFRNGSTESLAPLAITGVPTARAMTSTLGRRCVIPPEGGMTRCWGDCGIECGLLSQAGKMAIDFADVAIADAVALSTGFGNPSVAGNSCALTKSGAVYCLGAAAKVTAATDKLYPWPVTVRDAAGATFSAISGWATATCGVMADQRVACWGIANSNSQLGVANASLPGTPFPAVIVQKESGGDLSGVVSISAGYTASCAVTATGELWCWGGNSCGQLGIGDGAVHNGAVKAGVSDVAEVTLGDQFVCARQKSGQVSCWGQQDFLGLGPVASGDISASCFSRPQMLASLPDATKISASSSHACALRTNGQLVCWGSNYYGELGDGTKQGRRVPTPVVGLQQP